MSLLPQDPKLLVGEGGYYHGVLEAAIQWIRNWDPTTDQSRH